jgi:hypothetical protein
MRRGCRSPTRVRGKAKPTTRGSEFAENQVAQLTLLRFFQSSPVSTTLSRTDSETLCIEIVFRYRRIKNHDAGRHARNRNAMRGV